MKRTQSIEIEYGAQSITGGTIEKAIFGLLSSDAIKNAHTLCHADGVVYPHLYHRIHLLNGVQLYQDMYEFTYEDDAGTKTGKELRRHLEAAFPEFSNPRDVVLYDAVMSRILRDAGTHSGVYVVKNNLDSRGRSFGCHENYGISKTKLSDASKETAEGKMVEYVIAKMLPFAITRQITSGSGHVVGSSYRLSQRSTKVTDETHYALGRRLPLFNFRSNEHYAEDDLRVHLLFGDSTMSEFTTYLKMGTTAIVLDMIEHGFLGIVPELGRPIIDLHHINEKGVHSKLRLRDGSVNTPIAVQRWYLDKAHLFYQERPELLDDITKDVLLNWGFVLDSLEKDYMSLERHIDWVIKLSLIRNFVDGTKGRADSKPGNVAEDLAFRYHVLRNEGFFGIQDAFNLERIITDADIDSAMDKPPQDTRASARIKFMKQLLERGYTFNVDWDQIRFTDEHGESISVRFPKPLDTYDDLTLF